MGLIGVDRRVLLTGALLLPLPALAQAAGIAALERAGTRLGVAALDTGNGRTLLHRADERFLMCSTFKLALAAAILRRVEHGAERLDRVVSYGADILLPVSPRTSEHVATGMTVEALCAAIIHVSDNAAANLLLASMGGPAAFTAFLRTSGDKITRLDRTEPSLNLADGEKDTTTPRAMMNTVRALLFGPVLESISRERLIRWMEEVTTGTTLLRAGLPNSWRAGDKTGRSQSGAINDIAITYPPGRAPIVICAYTEGGNDATLAEIGRAVSIAML